MPEPDPQHRRQRLDYPVNNSQHPDSVDLAAASYAFFQRIHGGYDGNCDGRGLDLADEVYNFMATIGLEVTHEADTDLDDFDPTGPDVPGVAG